MRYNNIISGDGTAPTGRSRLRSVHDGSITDNSRFTLCRARLILQGNVTDTGPAPRHRLK